MLWSIGSAKATKLDGGAATEGLEKFPVYVGAGSAAAALAVAQRVPLAVWKRALERSLAMRVELIFGLRSA